jgi:hypothetical protein
MELRVQNPKDAELIEKVVYTLHKTFREPVVEVLEPPFRLTKTGWGIFNVCAEVHLKDGRTLPTLEHMLCFDQEESFRTHLLPLKQPQQAPAALPDPVDDQAVVRSTFLFTDGEANVGIKESEPLCQAVEGMCSELGSKRCTISTFGFGAQHSADLLRDIAAIGKGVYCFVENTDSIGEAFGEALGGLLSVTHQNVRLCLELAPGVTLVKARTTYQVSAPTQGDDGWQSISIDVGDLYAEERRDIPIELSLPEATSDEPNTIGRLHARGFSVGDSRSETTGQTDLAVERLEDAPTDFGHAHPQVQRHRNRYIASEALEQARAAARRGELEAARKLVSDAIKELQGSSLAVAGCQFTTTLLADL